MSANTNNPDDFIALSAYPQAIIHVDCDAFFTSCEASRDPSLKGRPVVTGKERGIVSCPSYEAKAQGVKRGMRLGEAKKLCAGLAILSSDYELYSIYSARIFTILRRFTPQVEEYSIDEAFCDLAGLRRFYRSSYSDIALKIKESVRKELDITVSIGLSLTKMLAKICSKENKPDGLTAVPGYRLHEFLKDKPLERVCGFGPNTTALLNKCGIHTILDYVSKPLSFVDKLLGKIGRELWHELRGDSVYKVSGEGNSKQLSISKTKTFVPVSEDPEVVKGELLRNMESAFIKLRRHRLSARSLAIILRREDFNHTGLEADLTRHSSSTLEFTGICAELFRRIFEKGTRYRATGVILSDIIYEKDEERGLFDNRAEIEKTRVLGHLIDEINASYGKHTIHIASTGRVLNKEEHPRNDLAWRKTALLRGETFRRRIGIPLLKLKYKKVRLLLLLMLINGGIL
ncbi:MAG: DNA polymerase IV [Candidatus Omnitrophica bacterium]|nr:DNA polymerase IV [Candidatus Omnitrophota bacterium]